MVEHKQLYKHGTTLALLSRSKHVHNAGMDTLYTDVGNQQTDRQANSSDCGKCC